MTSDSSVAGLQQRNRLRALGVAAALLATMLLFAARLPSPWHGALRFLALLVGGFCMWSAYRLFRVADELQLRLASQAFAFAFLLSLAVALVAGLVQGFAGARVSWLGVLYLLLVPWSAGLLLFSWRYR